MKTKAETSTIKDIYKLQIKRYVINVNVNDMINNEYMGALHVYKIRRL